MFDKMQMILMMKMSISKNRLLRLKKKNPVMYEILLSRLGWCP